MRSPQNIQSFGPKSFILATIRRYESSFEVVDVPFLTLPLDRFAKTRVQVLILACKQVQVLEEMESLRMWKSRCTTGDPNISCEMGIANSTESTCSEIPCLRTYMVLGFSTELRRRWLWGSRRIMSIQTRDVVSGTFVIFVGRVKIQHPTSDIQFCFWPSK